MTISQNQLHFHQKNDPGEERIAASPDYAAGPPPPQFQGKRKKVLLYFFLKIQRRTILIPANVQTVAHTHWQ